MIPKMVNVGAVEHRYRWAGEGSQTAGGGGRGGAGHAQIRARDENELPPAMRTPMFPGRRHPRVRSVVGCPELTRRRGASLGVQS